MITIQNVSKSFGPLRVLDGLDLKIADGKCLVVLGRSGTGKSVLLKLIVGLMKPDRGSIFIDDQEVNRLDPGRLAELRRQVGMLFQGSALFDSMTVGDNIGLALREHTHMSREEIARVVAEKLSRVGLPGSEAKRPADLSGGMRKRVGLARAIVMNPKYVLYDEPTTGLDPISAQQINTLIRGLQEKREITSIVVTHDMKSAAFVGDRLVLLHEGKVYFDGTPQEMEHTEDPIVLQFLRGEAEGPMTETVGTGGRGRRLGWRRR